MKSSLTGEEEVDIYSYRKANREFPHQSTGDQFFDREQFEAYRALGYHIMKGLAGRISGWKHDKGTFKEWFEKAKKLLRSDETAKENNVTGA